MQRAFLTPRGPHVAPLEVLLEKGLPPRHCTGLTDGRGLPASKRLCPPSPVIDFPPPGRSTPPSSHGSAPQDKPSTPALYWPHGRAGLTSVKTVVPSLTDHRLSAAGASNPSLVASPVTALATISPRGASNTRLRVKSHGQCVRRRPRDMPGQASKQSLGAMGLDKNDRTPMGLESAFHRQSPPAHVGVITVLGWGGLPRPVVAAPMPPKTSVKITPAPWKVGTSIATISAIPRSISLFFHASHASRGTHLIPGVVRHPLAKGGDWKLAPRSLMSYDAMPCMALPQPLTLVLPQQPAKHLPYKELL